MHWKDYLFFVENIGTRYFALATIAFLLFYVLLKSRMGYRKIQSRFPKQKDYGWVYFFAAFPLLFFIHDTYFYWTHRLMHHKKLFTTFHLVHHHSTNPSPWAAYAFHPLEAIVEAGVFGVFLFAIPVHPMHFYLFFFFMISYNVYGHLGYELYPKGFNRHWLGKWINTSVSHNQHHQFFTGNYGLYFTFWDRMMGTLRNDYDQHFEAAKTKQP